MLLEPLLRGTVRVLVPGVDPPVGKNATTWAAPFTSTFANL